MKQYDKQQSYESEIATLIHQLEVACYEKGLPLFCTVAVLNTDDGKTEYKTEYVSPDKVNVKLNDDHISRHVNVYNGYNTKLPGQPIVMDL